MCSSQCGFSWRGVNRRCTADEVLAGYCEESDIIKEVTNCLVPACPGETNLPKMSGRMFGMPELASGEEPELPSGNPGSGIFSDLFGGFNLDSVLNFGSPEKETTTTGNTIKLTEEDDDLPTKPRRTCQPADVSLVIDSSSSITEANFKVTRTLIAEVLNSSISDFTGLRFAAMRYNWYLHRLWGFKEPIADLDPLHQDFERNTELYKEILYKMVMDIPYDGRGTKTGAALEWTRRNFLNPEASGIRPDSRKIVVVVTDGKAQDNKLLQQEQRQMTRDGVEIIAIGITKGINDKGLRRISGEKGTVVRIPTYNMDDIMAAVPKIKRMLCKDVETLE